MKGFNNAEFKLGWRVLILALVGVATSSSSLLLYSFSSMVIPLQTAMGWDRAQLQAAITALSLGTIVASQLAGWLNLRYGLRRVTLVSLVALALSVWALTGINGPIWRLYLGFFLVPLAGLGTLQVTWSHLVNLWFEENRGLALAIILSGSGLAAIGLPLITAWAIIENVPGLDLRPCPKPRNSSWVCCIISSIILIKVSRSMVPSGSSSNCRGISH